MFINFTKRFPFWPQYLAVLEGNNYKQYFVFIW